MPFDDDDTELIIDAINVDGALVSEHEDTYNHDNLPTTAEKAGLDNAPTTPSAVNPYMTQADVLAGGGGDVAGPASAVDNAVARFDLTTGKIIQSSPVIISDAGAISGVTTVDGRDVAADGTAQDARLPTSAEKDGLSNAPTTPSAINPFITLADVGGGSGDVVGPASATDNALARYDTTTGKLIQGSVIAADDSGNISGAGTFNGRTVEADGATLDAQASAISANTAKVSADGLVTTHSDVTGAGSGIIISGTERTKLGGVEALADVTDTANVAAAGALMDSEVSSLSGVKSLTIPDSTTVSAFAATLTDDATAAAMRATIDVDQAGTDNSTPQDETSVLLDGDASTQQEVNKGWDGTTLDMASVVVSSDGAQWTCTMEKSGTGDVRCRFQGTTYTLDCTAPIASVNLVAGTAQVPQENYIYIVESGGVLTLTAGTVGFAPGSVRVATAFCQDVVNGAVDNAFEIQGWSDHVSNGTGHIADINAKLRALPASWTSGVAPSDLSVSSPDAYISTGVGNIFQLHSHVMPARNMATGSPAWLVNDPTTAYKRITTFDDITQDSAGGAINNRYFPLVLWGAVNDAEADCKLFFNLPSGTYNSASNAEADANNYANYNIPPAFMGVGFLVARYNVQGKTSGAWVQSSKVDLRGLTPAGSPSAAGGITDHGNLAGLTDIADHPDYVVLDGTRPMTAAMDLGGFGVADPGNVITSDTAAQISVITEKASPVSGDWLLLEDSADSNNKKRTQVGNLPGGGGSGDVVGPASAADNALARYDTTTGKLIQNSVIIATDAGAVTGVTTLNGVTVEAHASRHERGGADAIDGDHIDITLTPANYTPSIAPAEAAHLDDLAAHLAGIDNALSGGGTGDVIGPAVVVDEVLARYDTTTGKLLQTSAVGVTDAGAMTGVTTYNGVTVEGHAGRHERAGADEIDGDHLDIDFTPTSYTPATTPAEAANVDDLAAHLFGIDTGIGVAFKSDTNSEISAITAKATPTTSDFLLIEDAAASNAKRRITIGDLPGGGGATTHRKSWSGQVTLGANNAWTTWNATLGRAWYQFNRLPGSNPPAGTYDDYGFAVPGSAILTKIHIMGTFTNNDIDDVEVFLRAHDADLTVATALNTTTLVGMRTVMPATAFGIAADSSHFFRAEIDIVANEDSSGASVMLDRGTVVPFFRVQNTIGATRQGTLEIELEWTE